MLTGIDHLVIAVGDLETAIARYTELGFTVVLGGRHPVATHNALIALADGAYLELLAFYEETPGHRWWGLLGLIDFCLRTDDLAGDTEAFRRAGVDMDGPRPFSRVRPDGYTLRWLLSVPRGSHRGVAPFLIQDETPREERVPREPQHPNRVVGIIELTVAVYEVGAVQRWYEEALGQTGQPVGLLHLGADGVDFTVGAHRLRFLAPRGKRGSLRDWLVTRGPSPYAATLLTAYGPAGLLDPARTLGARLELRSA
ncbi:MAG: VOC family protein [Candidatus Rokubacteria bacterium]|nr:VOC family protein [Candidatus Rokubacteria bacterium]